MNSFEPAAHGPGHGPGQQSLAHPGNVFDQHVASGEEGDKNLLDRLRFSHDDPVDIPEQFFRSFLDPPHVRR